MAADRFEEAFAAAGRLAANFRANAARYLSAAYQEAEVRKDFIDKLLIGFGWDVNHDIQTNPYQQEAKVERAHGPTQRRADYAFYVAPNFHDVRFFAEAKKPAGDLATPDNCFQTIRYGWNAKTPLAILTSFEELCILDCRYKPNIETATRRVLAKYHYSEYEDREKFAEVYWLFSHEAVAADALERRARDLPAARGRKVSRRLFPAELKAVDEAFLGELDEFRTGLARGFKRENATFDGDTLTELAQRTIDRLVFMRFLEDKGIEPDRIVDEFGSNGTTWEDFITASRRLDKIYNGIVFKRHGVLDEPTFTVDDGAFAGICEQLAHLNSPYDFNAIPIHILGSIYERFLGSVIVSTNGSVRVDQKAEVRKAGGVYYTPEYIVRHIVQKTVGALVTGKTPTQIARMRFADISCGSGSFLLGMYDFLLTYHGNYYNAHREDIRKNDCVERDGRLYLSLHKRREILINNIYGVDVDPQAVEVAQLSLYLKLLQEETLASAHGYQREFRETLLPSLSRNVVAGNSLVGADVVGARLFSSDRERKLNPMDFKDVFRDVMKGGGFDAIVGNPPWLMAGYYAKDTLDYLRKNYLTAQGKFDLYYLFLERAIGLISKNGIVGMIVPNKYFHTKSASRLRHLLTEKRWIREIYDFGDEQVFAGATNYSCTTFVRRVEGPEPMYARVKEGGMAVVRTHRVPWKSLSGDGWHFESEERRTVFEKIESSGTPLGQLAARFGTGVQTGADRIYMLDPRIAADLGLEPELLTTVLRGRDVRRYEIGAEPKVMLFPYEVRDDEFAVLSKADLRKYEHVASYLSEHKARLDSRVWFGRTAVELAGEWYGVMYLDARRWFVAPHILTPSLSNRANFTMGTGDLFATGTAGVTSIVPRKASAESLLYLLGLLNSKVLSVYAINHSPIFSGGYYKFSAPYLKKLPIREVSRRDKSDQGRHDQVVERVGELLGVQKAYAAARLDRDMEFYAKKSAGLLRQIDELSYELYGLTDAEVRVIEAASEKATADDVPAEGSPGVEAD